MPADIRIRCVNEMFLPADLTVRAISRSPEEAKDFSRLLPSLLKESGEANVAVANLLDGATPEELAKARKELTESIDMQKAVLEIVETAHAEQWRKS